VREHNALLTFALDERERSAFHATISSLGGKVPAMHWTRGFWVANKVWKFGDEKCLLPILNTTPRSSEFSRFLVNISNAVC